MSTEIKKCGCDGYLGNKRGAEYQDKKYGTGMRAHNIVNGEQKKSKCSVCGRESGASKK